MESSGRAVEEAEDSDSDVSLVFDGFGVGDVTNAKGSSSGTKGKGLASATAAPKTRKPLGPLTNRMSAVVDVKGKDVALPAVERAFPCDAAAPVSFDRSGLDLAALVATSCSSCTTALGPSPTCDEVPLRFEELPSQPLPREAAGASSSSSGGSSSGVGTGGGGSSSEGSYSRHDAAASPTPAAPGPVAG